MRLADENKARIVPVDSEHSAIFQCLQSQASLNAYGKEVRRLILTASGGPFFGRDRKSLRSVTKAQALNHPNWEMGAKITIDSATLMNKGREVLEAAHLFHVPLEKVEVLVHRQSIIHSMVEFVDNAVLAQMGKPDMKLPIQYALTFPRRTAMRGNELDLLSCGDLTFAPPDRETFRCLELAYRAGRAGGTMPAVLNGANEAAVELFLQEKIGFLRIADIIENAMDAHTTVGDPALPDILRADGWAREYVRENLDKI
jgi:1-deoxy-D-xylulose-5-phosphate reductoisomerase